MQSAESLKEVRRLNKLLSALEAASAGAPWGWLVGWFGLVRVWYTVTLPTDTIPVAMEYACMCAVCG